MSDDSRYKPGDIVKLVLTGEKVMVLDDLSIAVGHHEGCMSYSIRRQDWTTEDVGEFELAPVRGGRYISCEEPRADTCDSCGKELPENSIFFQDRHTGITTQHCSDHCMRAEGGR